MGIQAKSPALYDLVEEGSSVEQLATAHGVGPETATDLHHDGPLVPVADSDLIPGRGARQVRHRTVCGGAARSALASSRSIRALCRSPKRAPTHFMSTPTRRPVCPPR